MPAVQIDLNCDMGEAFGRYTVGEDAALLDIVTSANIACGMHAGDPIVMRRTVSMATDRGVAVGAHPGYPDLQGFGRRAMGLDPDELEAFVLYQLGALAGFAAAAGTHLVHCKPHGALYNLAAHDAKVAAATARAIAAFDPEMVVVTLPDSTLARAAAGLGLRVAKEGFADRAYLEDGRLVPRSQKGAVLHDPAETTARAIQIVTKGTVTAITGKVIPLEIDTLCVHGDTPGAVAIARALREALETAGVTVQSLQA
jgi:UPF0271 protein